MYLGCYYYDLNDYEEVAVLDEQKYIPEAPRFAKTNERRRQVPGLPPFIPISALIPYRVKRVKPANNF